MPDPKLSVLVRVDLDGRRLRLIVTGCLTAVNQQGLHPLIDRARTLTPAAEVVLDLSTCTPADLAAVALLRAGIDQQSRDRPGGVVEIVPPEPVGPTGIMTPRDQNARSDRGPVADCARRGAR